jgi:hypothetical protein
MYECTTATGVRQGKASGQGREPSADTGPYAGHLMYLFLVMP